MFIISTPMGFVDTVDGHYTENFTINYARFPVDIEKKFVSKKTARLWANAYQLEDYDIVEADK